MLFCRYPVRVLQYLFADKQQKTLNGFDMLRVLIVDDDENVRLFIGRLLRKKFNCTVFDAANGLEALSAIRDNEPELVFLDITMPLMDGIEALEAIRSEVKFKNLYVVMLTAVSDSKVVSKINELGVFDYILKPLSYSNTYERLKEIFEEIKKEQRERERLKREREAFIVKKMNTAENTKDKILIVDRDREFRSMLKAEMEKSYTVLESNNGADGLKIFFEEMPKIVCLGENLPLLKAKLFAQKIRSVSNNGDVTIFAIKEDTVLTEEEKNLYDLVIPKNGSSGFFKTPNNGSPETGDPE